jgi:hypothetical protein
MANVTSGHKRKALLPTTFLLGLVFYSLSAIAQIRVIDNKGTIQMVDTSKWKLNGNDIGNKNTGNVGIGTDAPMAKLHNTGATILGSVALTDFAANAPIGTAAATVDTYSGAVITQTTAGITLTLPNPTNNPAGRVFQVSNAAASAQAITVQGVTIAPGSSALYRWDGAAWNTTTALANNIPLSGLTEAIKTNTIDNTNYAQVWNWSTANTQTPLSISANALTSGNMLSLASTATGTTGSLLNISSASAAAVTGGLVNMNFTGAHTGNGLNITDATTTGTAVGISAAALTSGSALNIAASTNTSTNGLLNVANGAAFSATATGKVATVQANVTPNSGLAVYANGNVTVGTATPAFTATTASATKPTLGVDGTINASNYTSPVVSLTDAATITWDLSQGNNAKVTLGAAGRTLNLVNLKAGMYGTLVVTQDATGSRTITTIQKGGAAVTSKVINGGGGTLSFTSAASAIDVHCFFYDGTNLYWTSGFNYN